MIGAIVAGGRNTRFGGEPKGLQLVGGARIIDRVASVLASVCDDVRLVANDPAAESWLPGTRVERDAAGARGSLVGIHTALRAATGEAVLVVAWDMPFVSRPLLERLAEALEQGIEQGIDASVPETDGGLEPFCAAYAASVLPHVERAIGAGEMRATRLIEALPAVVRVAGAELRRFGDPARLFFNVNSAADLAVAGRMARER